MILIFKVCKDFDSSDILKLECFETTAKKVVQFKSFIASTFSTTIIDGNKFVWISKHSLDLQTNKYKDLPLCVDI